MQLETAMLVIAFNANDVNAAFTERNANGNRCKSKIYKDGIERGTF